MSPPTAPRPDLENRVDVLLDAMTLEEQVALLAGADFWTTVPIDRLGIPAIKVSDGPNGARGGGTLVGGVKAASFPVGIALASTWNTALVEQIGQALAAEARSKGARVLLAPTVNIHRSTLNGRNFECYSEDPFLTARLAVAYIEGLQSRGVSATIKHFVGNESEFERMTISSEIGERALREIYLPPFEAAVKEAGTWAIMSSYNRLNGTYVSERADILIDLLKREWGFDGLVMSDWFATHSTAAAQNGGLDLEMPGPARFRGAKLVAAVAAGEVSPEAVRESARRVLRLIGRVGAFDDPVIPAEQARDLPEHRALIRRAGAEGVVLLKNDGILPLDKASIGTLALLGPNAKIAQIMGGGSAQLNAHYRVTPYEGIAAQAGEQVELADAPGCTNFKLLPALSAARVVAAGGQPGFTIEYFNSADLSGDVVFSKHTPDSELMWFGEVAPGVSPASFSARLTTRLTPAEDGEHQFGLVSAGLSRLYVDGALVVDNWSDWRPGDNFFGSANSEKIGSIELRAGKPYDVTVTYSSPTPAQGSELGIRALRIGAHRPLGDQAIDQAVRLAAAADVALLFVGLNGEWDTEGSDRANMDLAGRQDELIAKVAAANPRTVVVLQTGGPITMPWLDQVPAVLQAWYPGQEAGNAIADVLFGAVNPAGRLPQTFPARLEDHPAYGNYPGENGKVTYAEGVFVGYRSYEQRGIATLFPFGFGLSYTSFGYGNLRLSAEQIGPGDILTVSVDVTNTGERAGQEVVQLYVRDAEASVARPPKELKGFAKVELAPGATTTVSLALDRRALAYWDETQHAWVAEAGAFEVLVGASSQDIRARADFQLTETSVFDQALRA
jgi:beta-glucosidase